MFYNLKIDERAIALRKVWLPIDKDGRIAFGKHIDEVHWEVHTFTSSAMGDIGAPALLFLTICKAAEMFCAGNDRMSQWTRLVLITSAYFDDIQAVGTTRKERDEMMEKIDLVLKRSGMPFVLSRPLNLNRSLRAKVSTLVTQYSEVIFPVDALFHFDVSEGLILGGGDAKLTTGVWSDDVEHGVFRAHHRGIVVRRLRLVLVVAHVKMVLVRCHWGQSQDPLGLACALPQC